MLLICGALAGPLFTFAWFVQAYFHADYNSVRHAVSSLSRGEFGWMQNVNFILTGILTLALAVGLWNVLTTRGGSSWGPILLIIVAVGFLGSGLFITDPLNGYPPATPPVLLPPTRTGSLHLFFAALIFGLPAACFVLARYFAQQGARNWSLYSSVTAITFILLYSITIAGFLQADGLASYAGLLQRISLTLILTWMTLLPIYLLHSTSNSR